MPTPLRHILRPAAFTLMVATLGIGLRPATAADEPAALEPLMRQLRADDWSARQSAEDAIVNLGASVVDAIQAASLSADDAEVRERLRSALQRIGRDELLRPTLVTVEGRFARPADAFEVLARAVGLPVVYESDTARAMAMADKPLQFAIRNEPWLPSLAQVMNRSAISARVEEGRLFVQEKPRTRTNDPLMQTLGAVAIRVDNTRQRRSLDLVTDVTSASTTLGITIVTEPKLRLRSPITVLITKLADENERELGDSRLRQVATSRMSSGLHGGMIQIMPQAGATKLAAFEGEVLMDLVTRYNANRVTDLATLPVTVSSPNGDITIDALVKTADAWELQLRMPMMVTSRMALRDPNGNPTSLTESLKVLDQNGKPMRVGTPEMLGVDNGVLARVSVQPIEPDAKPTTIEWNLPAQSRQVRLPFKFADQLLP